MTPEPGATVAQRITELEAAAHIAEQQGDYVFARELLAQVEALRKEATP